jgi:hypothetical protein
MENKDTIKKKRGRKPKNCNIEDNVPIIEKKKRGRKKKYELENFDKISNRNEINNFNHNVVYSDNEVEDDEVENKFIQFGNLNITVSKKNVLETTENTFKGLLKEKPKTLINENELESDEEQEVDLENILNSTQTSFEKIYKENKKYVTDFTENIKEQSVKRMRVVTCLKNVVNDTEWPQTCDICCWWCCHKFQGVPCTLPTRYDPLRKRFTFTGIFCSWNCSKSYNNNMSDHKRHERTTFLSLLIQQLYGIDTCLRLKPAPPRECLKMFGGYLDIAEFRNKYDIIDSYHINLTRHNFVYPEVCEITNIKVNKTNQDKRNLRLQRI